MARRAAKLVSVAENRLLAGEYESQDSQDMLEMHMREHGIGVLPSSLSPAPINAPYKSKRSTFISSINITKENISHPSPGDLEEDPKAAKQYQSQNALNALNEPGLKDDSSKQQPNQTRPNPNSSTVRSSLPSLISQAKESTSVPKTSVPVPPIPDDGTSAAGRSGLLIGNDAPPTVPASSTLKKPTGEMSSDSSTQSNDDRSYEQYNDNSQLPSTSQASSVHEHRTLHEDDTGFLNFRRTQYDIPDSVPEEDEGNGVANNAAEESQPTSQAVGASGPPTAPPETPAIGQMLFQHSANGADVIPLSQLFGQTQWTSAVRKASPTSSRPSPNVFNHNAISPNLIASSPLKHKGLRTSPTHPFTSSPTLPEVTSRPLDRKTPSAPTNGCDDEASNQGNIAETPTHRFEMPRRRNVLEPISEYKSLRKQSLETDATNPSSQDSEVENSESEADVAARRRRLAKLRQERASKSFPAITLPRSSSNKVDNVEVPSTSRAKSFQGRKTTNAEQYLAQLHTDATDNKSQETVADSQEVIVLPQSTETNPKGSDDTNERRLEDTQDPYAIGHLKARGVLPNTDYRDTIPETSPPATSVQPPKWSGNGVEYLSSARSETELASFPPLSNGTDLGQQQKESNKRSSPEAPSSIPTVQKPNSDRGRSPPSLCHSVFLASSPQTTTRKSARLKTVVTPSPTGHDLPLASDPGTRTSTLSSLSATPKMSSSITPTTEPDCLPEGDERRSSSPAVPKVQRRGRPPSTLPGRLPSLGNIKNSRSREGVRRSTRFSSVSTDELVRSPSSISSREEFRPFARKPARQSNTDQHLLRESNAKRGLFEGMVFALSFQSGQDRKRKEKPTDRAVIERMIRQEGGKILSDGFDELFRFDSFQSTGSNIASRTLSSSLTLLNQDTGFTALIADGHSRKVKYMQALALGIPCLAPRWITNCISKREIIDWTSYLLCAGPSAVLGEAIRSRNLQAYDPSTIKLADVINERPKFLNGARILLVMKKTKNEGKRLPYVFLAQVLGGSLVRVYSLEEARVKLREEESQNQPFDWVYVDDHLHDAQNTLFGQSTSSTTSKKRKRRSTDSEETDRPPKKIRTLSDELVIQSLILGRLIEDGEMDE